MIKWEYYTDLYTTASLMDLNNKVLNSRGQEGWELVCLERVNVREEGQQKQWLLVFKRQLSGEDG